MPRCLLVAVALAVASGTACTEEPTLRWRVEFATPALEMLATAIEVRVLTGGCTGSDSIYRAQLTRASSPSGPGRLARGRYGLFAAANDESCRLFAQGCNDVDIPASSDSESVVLLQGVPDVDLCPGMCTGGRCPEPIDGGPGGELCNGADDDGDTRIDEGFDLVSDPSHCGSCDHACPAGEACTAGLCAHDVAQITPGADHTCARRQSGELLCWGQNANGELGDGTTMSRVMPRPVPDIAASDACTGGNHTCALVDGAVSCWGSNVSGQVGDGTTGNRNAPTAVVGLTERATDVDCGGFHTCALLQSGHVACWGWNNVGQLGVGTTTNRSVPGTVENVDDAIQISANNPITCALRRSHEIVCWGANDRGSAGDGTMGPNRVSPGANVTGITDAIQVAAGGAFACALHPSGTVDCWGGNEVGQLGDGTSESRSVPGPVLTLDDAIEISAGGYSACARTRAGTMECWGHNEEGELGDGTMDARQVPGMVAGLPTPAVRLGELLHRTSCVIVAPNEEYCWGYNGHGGVGDGTIVSQPLPVRVMGLP